MCIEKVFTHGDFMKFPLMDSEAPHLPPRNLDVLLGN